MPKRGREQSCVRRYRLSGTMTLRIRFAGHNTDGSVILILDGQRFLECVRYEEHIETEYTGEGWIGKYRHMYEISGDPYPEQQLIDENESAKNFRSPSQTVNVSRGVLAGQQHDGVRLRLVSWDQNVLELKMEWDVEADSQRDIARTEHASLRLMFAELSDFE